MEVSANDTLRQRSLDLSNQLGSQAQLQPDDQPDDFQLFPEIDSKIEQILYRHSSEKDGDHTIKEAGEKAYGKSRSEALEAYKGDNGKEPNRTTRNIISAKASRERKKAEMEKYSQIYTQMLHDLKVLVPAFKKLHRYATKLQKINDQLQKKQNLYISARNHIKCENDDVFRANLTHINDGENKISTKDVKFNKNENNIKKEIRNQTSNSSTTMNKKKEANKMHIEFVSPT